MTNEKDQLKELKDLNSKMDVLIKLTAVQVLGNKKKIDAVPILADLGFTEGKIADLLSTTVGSVHRTKQYLRKKKLIPKKDETSSGVNVNSSETQTNKSKS